MRTLLAPARLRSPSRARGGGGGSSSTSGPPDALLHPATLTKKAPQLFDISFQTTKGDFVVTVHRTWAPHGADRLYNLAKAHFFDGVEFFRVVPDFVVAVRDQPVPAGVEGLGERDDPRRRRDDPEHARRGDASHRPARTRERRRSSSTSATTAASTTPASRRSAPSSRAWMCRQALQRLRRHSRPRISPRWRRRATRGSRRTTRSSTRSRPPWSRTSRIRPFRRRVWRTRSARVRWASRCKDAETPLCASGEERHRGVQRCRAIQPLFRQPSSPRPALEEPVGTRLVCWLRRSPGHPTPFGSRRATRPSR